MATKRTSSAAGGPAHRKRSAGGRGRPPEAAGSGPGRKDRRLAELDELRMLLRTSPAAIFRSDAGGGSVFVSGRLYDEVGFAAEEIRGDGWSRILHPEDCARVVAAWAAAVAERAPFKMEYRLLARDGSERWVLAQAAPILDPNGGFAGHVGSVTDITDQKRLESALRKSEERYRTLYEETPAMLHSMDRDGRLIGVSNQWLKVLGYERAEVIGRKSTEFLTPACRRYATEVVIPKFLRTGLCLDTAYQYVKKDGSVIDVLISAIAERDADGRVRHSIAVLTDVTERRRAEAAARSSEARLKTLIDNTPMGIWVKDLDGRYLLVNREFERLLGVARGALQGKTAHEIFTRADADAYTAHDRDVLRSAAPIVREVEWRGPDGVRISATVKFPIFDAAGALIGLGCVETDITERKRAERELHDAKEQAERATRAKSEFLANMSHELRTPLNAIIGFSEVMKGELFGRLGAPCYRQYAEDIHDSGTHLLDLINDILDLSKVEAGKVELREEVCNVAELVTESVRLVLGRAQDKGLDIERRLGSALPGLRADRRFLKQVLLNLLSNAVKFTPEGGRITVIAECAGDRIRIGIIDTGVGMGRDEIPRALEPFEQIESAFSRRHDGSGLGLPLAKALAELHGGALRLESEAGRGTAVTVEFPAERSIICEGRSDTKSA